MLSKMLVVSILPFCNVVAGFLQIFRANSDMLWHWKEGKRFRVSCQPLSSQLVRYPHFSEGVLVTLLIFSPLSSGLVSYKSRVRRFWMSTYAPPAFKIMCLRATRAEARVLLWINVPPWATLCKDENSQLDPLFPIPFAKDPAARRGAGACRMLSFFWEAVNSFSVNWL